MQRNKTSGDDMLRDIFGRILMVIGCGNTYDGVLATIVNRHDDHRVVMALALAGLAADGTTTVTKAESAGITFPNFVELMQKLGAKISTRQ